MNLFQIISSIEIKLFLRNRFQLVAFALFFLIGIYSIYYGRTEISRQSARIAQVADSIKTSSIQYQQLLQVDTTSSKGKNDYELAALPSLVRFRYNFVAANKPSAMAIFSLGQRDLYPYYYILNAQNLYSQTLKGEIYNPFKLAVGNFDLSFVMIYLMPLLIISFAFDVLSFEKDMGTYTALRMSRYSLRKLIMYKLGFRFLFIVLVSLLLSLIGFLVAPIALLANGKAMFLWLAVTLAYQALWFALLLLINSFRKNTAFNASVAVFAWIVLLIVIPSLLNLIGQSKKQASAISLATLMRSRSMPEEDGPMKKALNDFYAYYPQLKPKDTTRSIFFYSQGYSAFLAVAQLESSKKVEAFYKQIGKQQADQQRFNWLNPAVNVQELFNAVAGTRLTTELAFKDAIKDFHQRIFWFSNTPLFANRLMTAEDYKNSPSFDFKQPPIRFSTLAIGLLQLAVWTLLLAVIGIYKLGEKQLIDR